MAHQRWARWAAQFLASELQQTLEVDAALVSENPSMAWQETVITQVRGDIAFLFPLPHKTTHDQSNSERNLGVVGQNSK